MKYNKKIKMIIGDNSVQFCNIFNDYLLNQKDIVVTGIANNGIELLKLIREKKPDLVVFDIMMPHLDGLGVLERLKTMDVDPLPRIIILSTISEGEIIPKAFELGADRYIVKPFDFDAFIKMVRQMFDNTLCSDYLFDCL